MFRRSEVVYKIVQPVAWDYIRAEPSLDELVRQADVLVLAASLPARLIPAPRSTTCCKAPTSKCST